MSDKRMIHKDILDKEVEKWQSIIEAKEAIISKLNVDIKNKENIISSLNTELTKKDSQINELIKLLEVE